MSKQEKSNDLDEYYQNCAYPKPKPAGRKRILHNGYKDKQNRRCYYTGAPGAERHEIWGGPWRQTSIDMGFQVDLSPEMHRKFHEMREDWVIREVTWWKKHYQEKYEGVLIETGVKPEHARECWMALIGKNYL